MISKSQETKTQQFHFPTDTQLTPAGTNYNIVEVAGGTSQQQRVGNQIKLTSFRLKGILSLDHGFTGNLWDIVRVVLYIPKDPDDTLNLGVSEAIDLDQFTILSDRLIPMGSNHDACKLYNKVLLFKKGRRTGMNVQFSSDLATAVTKNNIKMYMVCKSAANTPKFNGYWRFYFKDS